MTITGLNLAPFGSGFKYFSELRQQLGRRATLPAQEADQLTDGDRRAHVELFT